MSHNPHYKLGILDLGDGRHVVTVRAGKKTSERIVPPAGEDYAFDIDHWARNVEVYVSAKGRSVRVYIDGLEII